jgi:bifunctional non-homologous end joining protein LigD
LATQPSGGKAKRGRPRSTGASAEGRLRTYREMRDFARTPEPSGGAAADADGARFVVQKHDASRLHYDLRLEQGGVLRSWALPKGPSLSPGEKRLAVEVEDHPLEYGDFEGTIPKGEYGGGTVMLWDRGRWSPVGDGVRDGRIDFELDGEKLRGAWTLTRTGGAKGDDANWLLIKRTDPGAPRLEPDDEHSVLTGRTMAQIERGEAPAEGVGEAGPKAEETKDEHIDVGGLDGAERAEPPSEPGLQLASLAEAPPQGDDWIHEIKYDGYRLLAHVEGGVARLLTRNGHDWTDRFPEIAASLGHVPVRRARLDGEVVALRAGGVSSFGALQEALSSGRTGGLRFQVFDVLHVDDHDLRGAAQLDRKRVLEALLSNAGDALGGIVRYSDHVVGKGPAFFEQVCRMGLEGMISKRADATYRAGRGTRWRKVKCTHRDEFVVGGFTAPKGSRAHFGALLLGAYDGDAFRYAGRVGTGFDERTLQRLGGRLEAHARPTSPFAEDVPDARSVTWTAPELVVEVAYAERTRVGRLRHATFLGVREDKAARDVTWVPADAGGASVSAPTPARSGAAAAKGGTAVEGARASKGTPAAKGSSGGGGGGRGGSSRRTPQRARAGEATVAGVRLTNADRVLYPDQGITKRDLAAYYAKVEAHVLPWMVDRPLALVRCPEGRAKACFYQKHPGTAFPRDLPTVDIAEKSGTRAYAYVRDLGDLVGLVQAGVLEIHVWGARVDDVERPDLLVVDLDPSPDVDWDVTRATALDLRERIDGLGLTSFLRTTGGKGLHLVVPLVPEAGWDEVKAFARALCERHAADHPERLTTHIAKAKRTGKVFLDYLRNGRGATAIANFSTRARAGAPVAVPLRWNELSPSLRADDYDVTNVPRRLAALRDDPWAGFADAARPITAAMRKEVGMR